MDTGDRELLNRWSKEGDADAFHEIVRRYAGMVYGACLRILSNPQEAEDVSQDCFLTLATAPARVRSSVGGWLHSLATHRSLDRLRSTKRRKAREERFAKAKGMSVDPDWDDTRGYIDEAIAALPEKYRAVVVSHFLDGQTYDAIANTQGAPMSTVASRARRGVELIRGNLKKRGIAIPATFLATCLTEQTATAAPAALIASLGKLAIAGKAGAGVLSYASFAIVSKVVAVAVGVGAIGVFSWWMAQNEGDTGEFPEQNLVALLTPEEMLNLYKNTSTHSSRSISSEARGAYTSNARGHENGTYFHKFTLHEDNERLDVIRDIVVSEDEKAARTSIHFDRTRSIVGGDSLAGFNLKYMRESTDVDSLTQASIHESAYDRQWTRGQLGYAQSLDGYLAQDIESAADLLLESRNLTLRKEQELVDGILCYVVEGNTTHGKYTLWLDPEGGYLPRKAEISKGETDRIWQEGKLVGTTALWQLGREGKLQMKSLDYVMDNVVIDEIDGRYVITQARTIETRNYSDGIYLRMTENHTRTRIDLNPDFEELGAFVPDLPEGHLVNVRNSRSMQQYEWVDGTLREHIRIRN